jgi:hypothetical protein
MGLWYFCIFVVVYTVRTGSRCALTKRVGSYACLKCLMMARFSLLYLYYMLCTTDF